MSETLLLDMHVDLGKVSMNDFSSDELGVQAIVTLHHRCEYSDWPFAKIYCDAAWSRDAFGHGCSGYAGRINPF